MKLPETKEETIEFMNRCKEKIDVALEINLKLRDQYKEILKLSKDEKQKAEIREKMKENDKQIEYFQWSLDCMEKRFKEYEEEDKKA